MNLRGWMRVLMLLLLAISGSAQAELRAWLDRDRIALGETVTLNVQVTGSAAQAPDFAVLDADFIRHGSSSSSQISISNGQRSASTLFAVALEARREGVITLPPLEVNGQRSEPLVLTVTPSPVSSGPGGDVFIEVEVSTRSPYVQQQVDYLVRLFFGVTVLDGQLDDPAPADARVLRLGSDRSYQAERGGRRYSVVERRFAIFPERSGALELAAPSFRGRGMDRGGLGSMFGGGIRLAARGEALQLEVKPRPATAVEPWLPARELSLESIGGALPDRVQVGEPISLTLRLRARGLGADQLPELQLPTLAGANVYPDAESSRDATDSGELVAERLRRFAIIPTVPGELRLDALQIDWWDVGSDQLRQARLPPTRIQVQVAPSAAAPATAAAATAPATPIDHTPPPAGIAEPAAHSDFWPWLSAFLLLGWLATGWYWRRQATRIAASPARANAAGPAAAATPPGLQQALRSGQPALVAAALRASAPAHCGAGLDAIAAQLADSEQAQAIRALERLLYAAAGEPDAVFTGLRHSLSRPLRWRQPSSSQSAGELPALYQVNKSRE